MLKKIVGYILTLFLLNTCFAQNYELNADAISLGNECYQLTYKQDFSKGSAWNKTKIDLSKSFDLTFNVYLGDDDNTGADGLAFVLQNAGLTAISEKAGGTMGFGQFNGNSAAITPSYAIEVDTYDNSTIIEIPADHLSPIINGNMTPTSFISGTIVQANVTSANIEDDKYHQLNIKWNPATKNIKVYFDCALRLNYNYNIIDSIFSGNSVVWYGITAATGGKTNVHAFCDVSQLLPENLTICSGTSVQLSAGEGTNYLWSPPTGLSDPTSSNPIVSPSTSTSYTLTFDSDIEGCDTSFVNISVDPSPSLSITQNSSICYGSSTILTVSGAAEYWWHPSTGLNSTLGSQVTATPLETTDYQIVGSNNTNNCFDTVNSNVSILPLPLIDLGTSQELCPGEELELNAQNDGSFYHWSTGSHLQKIIIYTPNVYWVEVTNTNTCTKRDSIIIEECPGVIYFPNSFTPNDDLLNDFFLPVISKADNFHMSIYDLWGELLFETNDFYNGWDGKFKGVNVPEDVYVYVVEWLAESGESEKTRIGHVTLIR